MPSFAFRTRVIILLAIWPAFLSARSFSHTDVQKEQETLEKSLYNLPDVVFARISKPDDPVLVYELDVRQPVDHSDPSAGNFTQRVVLTHRGFGNVMVMNINGYDLYKPKNELTLLVNGNELNIEYRYFGSSKPEPPRWEYLTYPQVAEDLHRIRTLFSTIYRNDWISTGISRGGQTAIVYRYFYPDDVSVTVPYVAPMINGTEDNRIYTFLDTIGTEPCRLRLLAFQKAILKKSPEVIERLKWYAKGKGYTFELINGIGPALELAVLEYPFSFWQVRDLDCDLVPVQGSADQLLEHLLSVVGIDLFDDREIGKLAAHYLQSAQEGGYYGYETEPLRKYLKYLQSDQNPSAIFIPEGIAVKPFDGSLMEEIQAWLGSYGHRFIYIYGGRDTWSACRVIIPPGVDSKIFMIPGANHYTARVKHMPESMRSEFAEALIQMAGIRVDFNTIR